MTHKYISASCNECITILCAITAQDIRGVYILTSDKT